VATPPRPTDSTFLRAIAIAEDAHAAQVDKLDAPYIHHVRRVVARVADLAPAEISVECQTAAALHDVVEDSRWTLEDLRAEGFPPEVVDAVDSVTKRDGEDYFDMVRRAAADPVGRWVKLADNLDNADPERAAQLSPDVRARLADKYAAARSILADHGAADPRDTR
jgi:(p)ppGpp synthase/HD superfamily hydrolase